MRLYDYVFERDQRTCVYCGAFAVAIDHVFPRKYGGRTFSGNLVAACSRCNLEKSGKLEFKWLTRAIYHLISVDENTDWIYNLDKKPLFKPMSCKRRVCKSEKLTTPKQKQKVKFDARRYHRRERAQLDNIKRLQWRVVNYKSKLAKASTFKQKIDRQRTLNHAIKEVDNAIQRFKRWFGREPNAVTEAGSSCC